MSALSVEGPLSERNGQLTQQTKSNHKDWIKAYICFFLLYVLIVLAVALFAPGSIGEGVSRNGLLHMVCCLIPATRSSLIPFWKIIPVAGILGLLLMRLFGYVAYDLRGFSPDGETPLIMFVASIAVMGVAMVSASWFARKIYPEFKAV